VTLWPLLDHVHRTVSPTEMLTGFGLNVKVPPGPTITSTIVLVADGRRSRRAGRLVDNADGRRRRAPCWGTLARLSPDSALTKNAMANMLPAKKSPVLHLISS